MFKACEKEIKTKAYSKEGLASNKMDPKEKAKLETRKWIGDILDAIGTSSEKIEAEIESIQSNTKKSKRGDAEKLDALQSRLNKHNHHQSKLEIVLRLVENDSLEPDQVIFFFFLDSIAFKIS